jgi:photosystem II stability/assembly factor-like uncharacterized protein
MWEQGRSFAGHKEMSLCNQIGWGVARSGDVMALVKTDNGGARWTELVPIVGP